jgi:hypothetical protein
MDIRPLAISFFAAFIILSLVLRGQYGKIAFASVIITAFSYLSNFGFFGSAVAWIATIVFIAKVIRFSVPGAVLFTIAYSMLAYIASLYTTNYFS